MKANGLDLLQAEFRAYWAIWNRENRNQEQDMQTRLANELVTLSLSDDPLFATGLLTSQGVLSYRTYVPIGTETNQLNGETSEHCTGVPSAA